MPPTVSVVMATYNRSNIIGFAIDSLIRGTFQDWELIVVGDCCTDDTAAVVSAIGDARIAFYNMAEHYGEQSGPNNTGFRHAIGKYLAFLNHDDLWLPDHLERSVAVLARENVDLVFGQAISIGLDMIRLSGATCGQQQVFTPAMSAAASLWVMRRDLRERVGDWKPSWQLRTMPSQDWLYRAHQSGAKILADPAPSAIIINSGARSNSYRDRQEHEHRYWHSKLVAPGFEKQLIAIQAAMLGRLWYHKQLDIRTNLLDLMGSVARNAMYWFNIWPPSIKYWMKYWRKGSFLRQLRSLRGLKQLDRRV